MSERSLQDLLHRPKYPSQQVFLDSDTSESAFIGAVGCGKTDAFCEKAILLSWLIPDNLGMLTRLHATELEKFTMEQFFQVCPDELILDFDKSLKRLTLKTIDPNKPSTILFTHIAEQRAGQDHLKGGNMGWVGVDQVEDIEEGRWEDIKGRLRRDSAKKHYAFANGNPRGHDWMWRRWIYPAEQANRVEVVMAPGLVNGEPTTVPSTRYRAKPDMFCVTAETAENLSLPKNYIPDKVNNNSLNWSARYIFCSFKEWSGRIYDEYDEYTVHNIDPFRIPSHWPTVVSIDVGGDAPWAIVVNRIDPKSGDVFVTNCFYKSTVLVQEVVDWIRDQKQSGIPKAGRVNFICDPENKPVVYELHNLGVICEAARKGPKVPGITRVAGYFHRVPGRKYEIPGQLLPDGSRGVLVVENAPRLWVFRPCADWRREHAAWLWKRDPRTNDSLNVPVDKNDHCIDAQLYALKVQVVLTDLKPVDVALEELKAIDWQSYQEAVYRQRVNEKRPAGMREFWADQAVEEKIPQGGYDKW